jgi:hypothetical protein
MDSASNGLIYGYSFYLDTMCTNWDGLILNNYEAVMPLPWRKKWGITYLYQPFLVAQLGVFGQSLSPDLLETFLHHIPKKFRYWDFMLNYKNVFQLSSFPLYLRTNYVLDLNKPYESLYTTYRDNIKRNIKKAVQHHFEIKKDFDVALVIQLAEQQLTERKDTTHDFDRFRKLYAYLNGKHSALTYGVFSQQGQLLASAVFFFFHNRAYYILVGNHPNGRTLGASHVLIDAFIKDHAGEKLILDFEGSDIHSLAFFYSSFGAYTENYAAIQLNKLPWYLKWVKPHPLKGSFKPVVKI